MAERSAFSCLFPFLQPSVIRPSSSTTVAESTGSPAPPRTSNCNEERHNSALAQAELKGVAARAELSSVSTSLFPDEGGKFVSYIDPAAFLIARLDEGWFSDNVMRFAWPSICHFPSNWSRRTKEEQVPLVSRDCSESETSEPSGLLPSDSAAGVKSPSLTVRKSIEMVQPLIGATSLSGGERDNRGLPGSKLPRLLRVSTDEDSSLSDDEKGHHVAPRTRMDENQLADANAEIGGATLKPASRRHRAHFISFAESSSRRLSDGDADMRDGTMCHLERVKEEGEFEAADDFICRTRRGESSYKARHVGNSERRQSGKALVKSASPSSDASRRKGKAVAEVVQVPAPPLRRRRKERLKNVKSLSDAEYDELRGCMDLGFNLNRDDLTPRVVNVFPALRSYKSGDDISGMLHKASPILRSKTHSPGVWTAHAQSPLVNWQIPASTDSEVDADLKAQLKFWAHSVAHSVSAEC